jgi:hypothetical protein
MTAVQVFQLQFVAEAPEELEEGALYVSLPFATVLHLCACGCKREVVTPLRPGRWQLVFDGAVTLRPSIGNWSLPCRSHYFIDHNQVVWARTWSDREVQERRENQAAGPKKRRRWRLFR